MHFWNDFKIYEEFLQRKSGVYPEVVNKQKYTVKFVKFWIIYKEKHIYNFYISGSDS
jgi:hypothetical protein